MQDVQRADEGGLQVNEAGGQHRCGSCARRTTTRAVTPAGAAAFNQDCREHAKPVTEGVKVAHPVDPGMLEAWNFSDAEPFLRYSHMDQCLDLEAVAPQQPVTPR